MSQPLPAPTLSELEIALNEAVSALVAYRADTPEQAQRARNRRGSGMRATDVAELLATNSAILHAVDLARSPVEIGIKRSIKELGRAIYELVGDDGMADVAERVAEIDSDRYQRRMSPIDSAWNGIGTWVS